MSESQQYETREGWLMDALELLDETLASQGLTLPAKHDSDNGQPRRVSCGWPSKLALSRRKRRVGECWHQQGQIFISPFLESPVEVLATLIHEEIHARLPKEAGHKARFKAAAKVAGLDGPATETHPSDKLATCLNALAIRLGPYPHKAIDASEKDKKQTTRLRLYVCSCDPELAKADGRTAKIRAATNKLQAHCDVCEQPFVLQENGKGN